MILASKVVLFVVGQVTLTHSFVFRSYHNMAVGKYLYFHYADNQEICLKSCYEESNCTYVTVYDGQGNHRCNLYAEGAEVTLSGQVYKIFRQQTDATCRTLEVASNIEFQKIQTSSNVSDPKAPCSDTLKASSITTFIASYYNNFRFFSEDGRSIPRYYTNSSYRLSFSKEPRSGCISVPVFKKTVPRRFYFGSIYNTTGYSFAGYAFAAYCGIDCLGAQEIAEYIDVDGNYIYDLPGKRKHGLTDTGLGQKFYVANVRTE